ncbi:hypothetical protein SAY87_012158 [Trapa incisa]|uniref:Uncharacterized protein n=1 Tax=Trapa incisa TaxID=236973 RepID=A0AAN7GKF2_9MYRT|nr:hypothetical protein SAY87_012158 [Trapa incisa]
MAKSYGVPVALIPALCLVSVAHCVERLVVEGPVFCDTCRVDFATPVSYDLKDAKVKVECRNRTTGVVTISVEGKTGKDGWYRIPVEGDHEEELCEVSLLESPVAECSEQLKGSVHVARISLTNRNGLVQSSRFASSLSYAPKTPVADCVKVLLEMGVLPPDFFLPVGSN